MILLKNGINEDIFMTYYIEYNKKILLTIISKKCYSYKTIKKYLIKEFSQDNILKYNIIRDINYKYYIHNIELDFNLFFKEIIEFINRTNYVFVENNSLLINNEIYIQKPFKRIEIPVDFSLPVLLISINIFDIESKIKLYDYRFKLNNKNLYKRGEFVNAYSSGNEHND